MSLHIVRSILTHELVGLYAAADVEELRDLVDEICTPSACEYASLPSGGVGLPDRGTPVLPMNFQTMSGLAGGADRAIERLRPTAGLMAAFCDDGLGWADLDPALEHPGSRQDAALAASRSPLSGD